MAGTTSRRYRTHCLLWIVLILFPVSLVGSGDVRNAQFLLHAVLGVFVSLALVWNLGAQRAVISFESGSRFAIFVAACLAYLGLLTSLNPMTGATGDYLDVIRPAVYAVYFLLPFVFRLAEQEISRLLQLLLAFAVLQVLFSAAVYAPTLWPLVDVFKGRPSDDAVVFHFFRWSGTSGYPSDFAFYLSFFLYLVFFAPPGTMSSVARWSLLALISTGIVLTMSRGGIASAAAMVAVGSVLFGRLRQLLVLVFLGCLALVAAVAVDRVVEDDMINPGYVLELIEQGTEAKSAQHRVNEIALAADYSSRYFPFGVGAARDDVYTRIRVIESMYGHYLVKWGFIGLSLFLVTVGYFSWASWRCAAAANDPWVRAFGRAFLLLTLSVPLVFGWSSAISDRFKGLPFYYLLGGYISLLVTTRMVMRHSKAIGSSHDEISGPAASRESPSGS